MKKGESVKARTNYLKIFIVVLGIILIFTAIDYLTHLTSAEYAVPSYYFRNKIIYGTIIGFIAYLILRKQKPLKKSLIFSASVAVLLQIRYALEGYALEFVILFLIFHFVMLFPLSWLAFRYLDT